MSVAARLRSIHAGIVLLVLGLAFSASAATLNVEFDVRTRVAEGDPVYKKNSVAIFVLDRSESMTWLPANGEKAKDGKVARNRNQLLRESFQDRIRTMSENEPNTKVFVLEFSYDIKPLKGPFALDSPQDIGRLLSWKGLEDVKCMGKTLLYDARECALEKAEEFYARDPSVKVELFVYTDGDNDTPPSGYWLRNVLDENGREKVDLWGNPKKERVKVRYSSRDNKAAKENFDKKWAKRKVAYSRSGNLELHWRWLGKGNPPPGIKNTRKDEYSMLMSSSSGVLRSPDVVFDQNLKVELTIPIPSQYEKTLKNLRVPVCLEVAGHRVSSSTMSLSPGKQTVSFSIPDGMGRSIAKGLLTVAEIPDVWDSVVLKPPAPLELTFSAPDRLAFTVVDPKGAVFVKSGTKMTFSAKATENADIKWSWPGGTRTTRTGEPCEMSFVEAAPFDVRLKAQKQGFLDSPEEKIRVHVIDADVGVRVETQHPTAGKGVDFVAKPHGKPDSYSWQIDGQTLSEQSSTLNGQVFGLGGKHRVKVTAYYGHGIVADSGDVSFDVEARPSIEIDTPESGNYDFGEKIVCKANVEGDFDKVVWELEGPSREKQEAVVDKTAKVSKPIFFVPAKGGRYTLKATANGPAGSLPAKASVALKVAHENLGVAIVSPSSGTQIPIGASEKGTNLVAKVKGDRITRVKWFVRKTTGEEVEIRTTPVQNAGAACSFRPDPTTKDGASLYVRAEAVFDGDAPTEPVTSPPIELIASRYAKIDIEAKVNGNEANGRDVCFGDQVELRAHCEGDIDSGKVQWYKSVDGVITDMKSVRGSHCTSPKEVPNKSLPNGDSLRTVHYFAVAGLSDGSAVTSRIVVVHHYCPDVKFAIKLPPGADGLPQRSFRPRDVVHLCLPESEQPFTDVEWDFGDGTKAAGCNVEHSYSDEKSHKITAKGRCAKCGKPFSAAVDVSTKCPDLELAVVLNGEERFAKKYGLKKPVNVELSVKNGDATEVSWDFGDGGTATGMEASHSYEKYGTYTITASAKCKRCGKRFTASSEKIEVTVIPPQAVLEIVEKGSHYGTGDKITLSAERSKGDIVDCIWEIDGKELVESRGKKEVDVKLPDRPCEMVAKVKLIGPESTEPSEAQREIRVRYGAKYMALLILLVVFVVCVLAWLFLNNEDAGWKVIMYCCPAIDHSTEEGKLHEKKKFQKNKRGNYPSTVCLMSLRNPFRFWSLVDKKATIILGKINVKPSHKNLKEFLSKCGNLRITVNPNSTRPDERVEFESPLVKWMDGFDAGDKLNYYQCKLEKDTAKDYQVLRFILDRSGVTHIYDNIFLVLTFCVIIAASWAALRFVI